MEVDFAFVVVVDDGPGFDLFGGIDGVNEAALRAGEFLVAAHEGRGHGAGGDDEGLGLEPTNDQREDKSNDDGLDGVSVSLAIWGGCFGFGRLGGAFGLRQSGGGPSHRLVFPLGRLTGGASRLPYVDVNRRRACGPESRSGACNLGESANLANVTNSARIGNPANRPAKDPQRHELARQMHQERLADKHRPAHDRARTPESGIIGDRAVIAQHEELIGTQLHAGAQPVRLSGACWRACRCSRSRDRSESR